MGGGGLNRDGGEGGLLNLEKTMVSVFPKDLQKKVDKLKYKKVGGHAASDKKTNPNFQLLNELFQIILNSASRILQC